MLDGFGVAPQNHGNAVSLAKVPTFNDITANFPTLTLQASGPLVGLPWGEMGNSEVGHLNIGAGRIVGQDLPRITTSIQNGDFFENKVFLEAVDHAKKNNSKLHLVGLVSTGGVHSLDEHMFALLGLAAEKGLKHVYIHMFTDGRDTEQKVAVETLKKLRYHIQNNKGVGEIASITGRFYAMDRGGHWDQTIQTYNALVKGQGQYAATAEEALQANYTAQIFDEMIKPTVMVRDIHTQEPVGVVSSGDAVIFTNFRSDRALQLTQAFVTPEVLPQAFRHEAIPNLYFATMTEYLQRLPVHVAFPPMDLRNNLAEVLVTKGFSQFHISESEKYAHVTVFFNCGASDRLKGEERVIVSSPTNNIRNYVDTPQMSAEELTDVLTKKILETDTNFYIANYANCDMVGHTGSLKAATQAVEFIDSCMKRLVEAAITTDAALIITADHGNVEQMINVKTGDIDKDHTTNPVPFLLVGREFKFPKPLAANYASLSTKVPAGVISDIAPTILDLFGIEKPSEMTGVNLLDFLES